jgi:MarR family transcriptional regulator, transcriptional regulator for hemolysin
MHEDKFFHELGTTSTELRQAFASQVGISAQRLQLLMRLRWQGETSHSDLRQALGIDAASITRLVKEFEADGLVARRVDPDNNRYTLAALTPTGERLAGELERAHRAYQHRLLDGISAEHRQTVMDLLQRVRTNVTSAKEQP